MSVNSVQTLFTLEHRRTLDIISKTASASVPSRCYGCHSGFVDHIFTPRMLQRSEDEYMRSL